MSSTDRLEQYYSLRRLYGNGVHLHWYERARAHRTLYYWLLSCLMTPRWRRHAVGLFVAAAVLTVGGLTRHARDDWNGYRLSLGGSSGELTLSRQPALGWFNPPLWRKELATGFLASQMRGDADVTQGRRGARYDWSNLESLLDRDARWLLRQADRWPEPASSAAAATPMATDWLQTMNNSGLARYASADPNFLPYIRQLLSSNAGADQKRAAIRMIGYAAKSLDAKGVKLIIDDLVQVIRKHDVELTDEAAATLVQIAQSVDVSLASAMVPVFRQSLSDSDPLVALPAAMALGRLGRLLGPQEAVGVASDLRDMLAGTYTGLRVAALSALTDVLPRAGLAAIQAMVEDTHGLLNSGAASIRKATCDLLGHLAETSADMAWETVSSDLRERLMDTDAGVRTSAAHALGNLAGHFGAEETRAVSSDLRVALGDADRDVQAAAAQAMGRLASASGLAAGSRELRDALQDTDVQVKRAAIQTLGSIIVAMDEQSVSATVNDLRAQLGDNSSEVRRDAIYALGKVAPSLTAQEARDVVHDFMSAIGDADDHIRRAAEYSLAYLSKTVGSSVAPAVAEQLLEGLSDGNADVQIASANALGRMAKFLDTADLEAGLKGLYRMRTGTDANGKRAAMLTLGNFAPFLEPSAIIGLTAEMLDELRKGDADTAAAAVYALGNMVTAVDGDTARVVAYALRQALASGDVQTRMAASYVLGGIAPQLDSSMSKAIAEDLRAALDSGDSGIRRAAAESLGKIAVSPTRADIRPIVGKLMQARLDEDVGVNDASGHALDAVVANLDGAEAQAIVEDMLQVLSSDETGGKNVGALVEALGVMASRMNSPALAGAAWMHLDALAQNDGAMESADRFRELRRTLAGVNWRQSTETLLEWLAGEDSRLRLFAAHVLAQRQPWDASIRERVVALRNDPLGRPWVKVAALRCLIEVERERQARGEDSRRKLLRPGSGTVVASS